MTETIDVTADDGHGDTITVPVTGEHRADRRNRDPCQRHGGQPQWVAFDQTGTYAYVVNQGTGTVSVIDTATKNVVGTLSTGQNPGFIARGPNNKIYVTNQLTGTVSVIDPATNTVTGAVNTGGNPMSVTFHGNRGYVATGNNGNSIKVFDLTTNQVVDTYTAGAGSRPVMARVTPDGQKLYVTNQLGNTLTVIDLDTKAVEKTFTLGNHPTMIEFDEVNKFAYVTVEFANKVSVIDTTSHTLVADIAVGQTPIGIQLRPDKKRAYVVNFTANGPQFSNPGTVSVVDLDPASATYRKVIETIPVGNGPVGATISPDGHQLWVINQAGTISIIPV